MTTAKDLTKEAPRSPRTRIGDYALMARMIDKGRATLNGTVGEYHFACPLDQMLFTYKGVQADDVKAVLASGASDDEFCRGSISMASRRTLLKLRLGLKVLKAIAHTAIRRRKNGSPASVKLSDWIQRKAR